MDDSSNIYDVMPRCITDIFRNETFENDGNTTFSYDIVREIGREYNLVTGLIW